MRIFNDNVNLVEPFPAVYIDELETLVIADLHLGIEGISAEQGVFIPKVQLEKILGDMEGLISEQEAKRILINGDIKHEFSETSYHEFKEIGRFFEFLTENFEEVIMVKGNHDNYIFRVTCKYDVKLYDEVGIGDYFFIHGHKDRNPLDVKERNIILAHEHPSIVLYTELGVKEKIKCFLHGEIGDKNILVMPAFSYFAEGSGVNQLPRHALLSPVLRRLDVDRMRVVGIMEKERYLVFPDIRRLRE
jgi:hypothetical protein